ncbi:unknown protein [Seminavis robusta]|uniref:Uncharacterized protein n=1 Tax=Seminavis robusta TaxID=568900 RepID=A0A9N8HCN2_9STRA|nr:unknown protein [Seminavis robusta]|eukprot:Sro325_g117760.1 n/a (590) ;mRNA; f:23842-25688
MNDRVFLILVRFLSIMAFGTSIFGCVFAMHNIEINEYPWVSNLFDISCEDLSGESREYCEASYNERHYTLWRSFGNFFSWRDWDGGVLCGTEHGLQLPDSLPPEVAHLIDGNIGQCSKAMANVAVAFAVMTCGMTAFLTIYITVLAHDNDALLKMVLFGAMATSATVIAVYCLEIDPLRLKPTFCDSQTLFEHCKQSMGEGFWFQVVTLIMTSVSLMLTFAWSWLVPPQVGIDRRETQPHHDGPIYLTLHFYVQLVRFAELAILIVGIVSTFTVVSTTIPEITHNSTNQTGLLSHAFAGQGGEMETQINLWQGLFCHPFGARLFLWSVVLEEADHQDADSEPETFGHCDFKDLFEVQMGMIMAAVSAITAMAFQKDAKSMPLAYMIGFIMHFMSMVKLTWAITAFMLHVFPGRDHIEPSYCSRWIDFVPPGGSCEMEVGVGIYLSGGALAAVAISFVGEVAMQQSSEYGVGTAFRTLMGRVRQGRFADLGKAASERSLAVGDVGSTQDDMDEQVDNSKQVKNSTYKLGSQQQYQFGPGDQSYEDDQLGEAPPISWSVILVFVMIVVVVVMMVVLVSVVVYEMAPTSSPS